MVSIKHGTILQGSDSAQPIGHGPIVHENKPKFDLKFHHILS